MRIMLVAALILLTIESGPISASDPAQGCCAGLEERIAEIEATVARKGNSKVSLSIAGQVNKAILFWDDGVARNAYVVGNKNDQTNFSLSGAAQFAPGWAAGFQLTLRVRDDLSDDVDQSSDNGSGDPFQLWNAHWFVENDKFGKVSLGLASRVSDTAPENDLSQTGAAAYAGAQDIGGAFRLRRADGTILDATWGEVISHFNGDTANIVRYDTPEFAGFIASASWGEDDIWDVGLKYEGESASFKLAASLAYTEVTDVDFPLGDRAVLVGSAAILHEPSGLNALVSGGEMQFDDRQISASGEPLLPADAWFVYAKLGWIARLNGLGATAFYGEYATFENHLESFALPLVPPGAGAQIVSGSDAEIWGAGVVQHIDAADMQVYIGYRSYSLEFDARAEATAAAVDLEDFHTIVAGSKISF